MHGKGKAVVQWENRLLRFSWHSWNKYTRTPKSGCIEEKKPSTQDCLTCRLRNITIVVSTYILPHGTRALSEQFRGCTLPSHWTGYSVCPSQKKGRLTQPWVSYLNPSGSNSGHEQRLNCKREDVNMHPHCSSMLCSLDGGLCHSVVAQGLLSLDAREASMLLPFLQFCPSCMYHAPLAYLTPWWATGAPQTTPVVLKPP